MCIWGWLSRGAFWPFAKRLIFVIHTINAIVTEPGHCYIHITFLLKKKSIVTGYGTIFEIVSSTPWIQNLLLRFIYSWPSCDKLWTLRTWWEPLINITANTSHQPICPELHSRYEHLQNNYVSTIGHGLGAKSSIEWHNPIAQALVSQPALKL